MSVQHFASDESPAEGVVSVANAATSPVTRTMADEMMRRPSIALGVVAMLWTRRAGVQFAFLTVTDVASLRLLLLSTADLVLSHNQPPPLAANDNAPSQAKHQSIHPLIHPSRAEEVVHVEGAARGLVHVAVLTQVQRQPRRVQTRLQRTHI